MSLQSHRKNGHHLAAQKQRNIRELKGRCQHMTARDWAAELGVSESTVRDYAGFLREQFKPARTGSERKSASESDCSLMVEWATRPIR